MTSTDLQRLIADAVHEAGFREYGAPTPHSVGLEHFDHPQQRGFYQEFVIPENAVLNVDMPFFEYGWGAIHLEDTIVVRGDGVEYLTSNQTGLIEIPV
jgi:Xaa-Pro aminopeptidase